MKIFSPHTYFAVFTLAVVLLFNTVGVLFCSGALMRIGGSGTLTEDCAGHGGQSSSAATGMCDHVSAWQRLTQMVRSDTGVVLLNLVLLLVIFLVPISGSGLSVHQTKTHLRTHERHRGFAFWIELFASGIVQPKIFA